MCSRFCDEAAPGLLHLFLMSLRCHQFEMLPPLMNLFVGLSISYKTHMIKCIIQGWLGNAQVQNLCINLFWPVTYFLAFCNICSFLLCNMDSLSVVDFENRLPVVKWASSLKNGWIICILHCFIINHLTAIHNIITTCIMTW